MFFFVCVFFITMLMHVQTSTLKRPPTVKFLNFRTPESCCNLPKIHTKRPKLRVLHQNNANGIENSEDPDQTDPLGAV